MTLNNNVDAAQNSPNPNECTEVLTTSVISKFNWIGKSEDGKTVTLHQFNGNFNVPDYATDAWMEENATKLRVGVAIDVETTGLSHETDVVIEVGLRQFIYHVHTGEIVRVEDAYSGLQDPGFPLSDKIKRITGITDEKLKGKSIDWEKVDAMVARADIVLAHSASFDRPFIDRNAPSSAAKVWGCSYQQIDWILKGYSNSKLEFLSIYHGFYTDAHRALNDSDALIHLLSFKDQSSGTPYLSELLTNARRSVVRVIAAKSPFETKDLLKDRDYSWDPKKKAWHRTVYKDELDQEMEWLMAKVYSGEFRGQIQELSFQDTFKPL